MKKLTCRELGGPCEEEISANTFEEMAGACQAHVMEQMQKEDAAHMAAVNKMREAPPEEQMAMMAGFKKAFDDAPEC